MSARRQAPGTRYLVPPSFVHGDRGRGRAEMMNDFYRRRHGVMTSDDLLDEALRDPRNPFSAVVNKDVRVLVRKAQKMLLMAAIRGTKGHFPNDSDPTRRVAVFKSVRDSEGEYRLEPYPFVTTRTPYYQQVVDRAEANRRSWLRRRKEYSALRPLLRDWRQFRP